ncbi:iron-siderophore ABC transporter substrate-binding protein [Paracoccus sediminilitoris]|uniref:iron-siderophore ABC transporter substrate-binding protein n=1 Tax=Paracoccus sediminilitoris TaxID=2202419 RepID=UPI000DBA8BAE
MWCRSLPCATALAACLSLPAAMPSLAGDSDYPQVITHALGTTTIPAKPQRIATVGWANHEVPLALGVLPVGFAAATFGDDDDDRILPWVSARLDQLDASPPPLFEEGAGIDFEAVAASRPDVILAAYSGLEQSEYDTLSMIAPVVAYPEAPWTTDWRDMIRLDSAGMGMAAEGDALIASTEAKIAEAVARHPQIRGKTAMFVTHLDPTDLSVVNFYNDNDARVRFFHDLGLASPSSVIEATKPGQFSGSISAERVDMFDDVDIIVTYGGPELLEQMRADPLLGRMPAVANDAVVMLGTGPQAAAANPTPLAIPYVLPGYVAQLAQAAQNAR